MARAGRGDQTAPAAQDVPRPGELAAAARGAEGDVARDLIGPRADQLVPFSQPAGMGRAGGAAEGQDAPVYDERPCRLRKARQRREFDRTSHPTRRDQRSLILT